MGEEKACYETKYLHFYFVVLYVCSLQQYLFINIFFTNFTHLTVAFVAALNLW